MAFIRNKPKNGHDYFSIVENYRVGENSKDVKQRVLEYIGTFENLKKLALKGWTADRQKDAGSDSAQESDGNVSLSDFTGLSFKSYQHGSGMALFYMAQAIGIEEILDEEFGAKTIKGMKRSQVLILSMIHRAIDPGSKRSFAGWASETSLPYHLRFQAKKLDSQAFWEAMDGIGEQEIIAAQRAIVNRTVAMTGVQLETFHLDYTNYYTFIDSRNNRCVICKRGHNKQKRDDLRQFSLAMLTSFALQLPMVWQLYEGNKNDKAEFPDFAAYVRQELTALGIDPSEATVTFDGGSNSEENFKDLGFHFICAHSMAGLKELYDIDIDSYSEVQLSEGHSRRAYRIDSLSFSGVTGTGILTYSKALEDGQVAELNRDIEKIEEACLDVNERLKKPASRLYTDLRKRRDLYDTTVAKATEYNKKIVEEEEEKEKAGKKGGRKKKPKEIPIWNEEEELLSLIAVIVYKGRKYMKEFTSISLTGTDKNSYQVVMVLDPEKKSAYCKKYYGKKLTCTDRTDWSTEKILREYSEQECIETNIFKVSKDTDHFCVRPQYHWTDDKIRVHVFICLTSMIIAEMLRIRMEEAGIKATKQVMLDRLSEIHDGWIFQDNNKVSRVMEEMDAEHEKYWNVVMSLQGEINKAAEKGQK